MIKAERALKSDIAEIIEVSNRIFRGDDSTYFQTFHPALYKDGVNTAELHIIIREEGKIKGLIGGFPSVMNVLGERIDVCGLGTMGVEKDCRGKGYMREIMETIISDIKSKNIPISILGGRRQRYEYYGFTPAGICHNFYYNKDNAKHVYGKDNETVYSFIFPNGTETELFEKCLKLYQRRPAYIERTAEGFYDCLINCKSKAVFIMKNNEFCGYACVSDNMYEIHEFELEDNSDCCRMLKDYIEAFNINSVHPGMIYPYEREKITALARVCEGVSTSGCYSYMINDFAKVITAFGNLKASYQKIPDGDFVVDIEGIQKIRISAKDNKISAIETDDKADIKLTSLEAVSAFFGQGAFTLDVCEKVPGFANALFPLPLFFTVPDAI